MWYRHNIIKLDSICVYFWLCVTWQLKSNRPQRHLYRGISQQIQWILLLWGYDRNRPVNILIHSSHIRVTFLVRSTDIYKRRICEFYQKTKNKKSTNSSYFVFFIDRQSRHQLLSKSMNMYLTTIQIHFVNWFFVEWIRIMKFENYTFSIAWNLNY